MGGGVQGSSSLCPTSYKSLFSQLLFQAGLLLWNCEMLGLFSPVGKLGSPGRPIRDHDDPTMAVPWAPALVIPPLPGDKQRMWAGVAEGFEIPAPPKHLCLKNSASKFKSVWKHSVDKKNLNHLSSLGKLPGSKTARNLLAWFT